MKKLFTLLTCVAITCLSLIMVACAPRTLGGSCEKLLEKGYEIESYYIKNEEANDEVDFLDVEFEGGAYIIEAYKETAFTERAIYVFVFDVQSDADKLYSEYKTDLKELLDDEGIVEKQGKILVIATEAAYEDFIA